MKRKYASFIVLGLIVGSAFGISLNPGFEKPLTNVFFGAVGGVFIGWFVAIAGSQIEAKKE